MHRHCISSPETETSNIDFKSKHVTWLAEPEDLKERQKERNTKWRVSKYQKDHNSQHDHWQVDSGTKHCLSFIEFNMSR